MLSPKQNIIFEVAYIYACCRSLWVLGIHVLFTLITLICTYIEEKVTDPTYDDE